MPGSNLIQGLKSLLRDHAGIPAPVLFVSTGTGAFLVTNWLLGNRWFSPWGLCGAAMLGIAIESYEIWDHYKNQDLFSSDARVLATILGRHATDILWMLAVPAALVFLGTHKPD